jgi:hypothetical protein
MHEYAYTLYDKMQDDECTLDMYHKLQEAAQFFKRMELRAGWRARTRLRLQREQGPRASA